MIVNDMFSQIDVWDSAECDQALEKLQVHLEAAHQITGKELEQILDIVCEIKALHCLDGFKAGIRQGIELMIEVGNDRR